MVREIYICEKTWRGCSLARDTALWAGGGNDCSLLLNPILLCEYDYQHRDATDQLEQSIEKP